MHRHPSLDPDADGRHLAFGATVAAGNQTPAASGNPPGPTPEPVDRCRSGPVPGSAPRAITSIGSARADDRIADQLAGTVPGDPAAAVDVDDRGAVGREVRRPGAAAGGVDGGVLQEHEHVRDGAVDAGGGEGPLASQAVRYSTRPSCSTCSGAVAARQDPVRSYPMPITLRRTGTHNTRTGTRNPRTGDAQLGVRERATRGHPAASPALVHASPASRVRDSCGSRT